MLIVFDRFILQVEDILDQFRVGPLYGDLKPFIYKVVTSKRNLKRQTQANFLIGEKFT
jgi:hypothetical protein